MNTLSLRPGTVIATGIPRTPFFHVGLLSDALADDGTPLIVSNSQRSGGVAEESIVEFGDPGTFKILGYWSNLPPGEVLARARQFLGTKWHLTGWNCEHFVRAAHGLKPESPQLKAGLTVAATILIVGLILLRRR